MSRDIRPRIDSTIRCEPIHWQVERGNHFRLAVNIFANGEMQFDLFVRKGGPPTLATCDEFLCANLTPSAALVLRDHLERFLTLHPAPAPSPRDDERSASNG